MSDDDDYIPFEGPRLGLKRRNLMTPEMIAALKRSFERAKERQEAKKISVT